MNERLRMDSITLTIFAVLALGITLVWEPGLDSRIGLAMYAAVVQLWPVLLLGAIVATVAEHATTKP